MGVQHAHVFSARAAYDRPEYQHGLQALCAEMERLVSAVVRQHLGPEEYSITARVKSLDSFAAKAAKRHPDDGSLLKYGRPLTGIEDQVAVRVRVLHTRHVDAIAEALQADDDLIIEDRQNKGKTLERVGAFGYGGVHLTARVPALPSPMPAHADCGCVERVEIQVRTYAQHAWAEVEHTLRYKGDGRLAPKESRDLDRAAALLETADEILRRLTEQHQADDERVLSVTDLLERRFPDAAPSGPATLRWIEECVAELGVSPTQLDERLDDEHLVGIARLFDDLGHATRSQVRQLDDAMLAIWGERHIETSCAIQSVDERYRDGRPRILRWRLRRLRQAGLVVDPA